MKKTILICLSFLILFFASQNLLAQEAQGFFKNFSFEDFPRPGIAPQGWFSYDFENQTPPDVHPCDPPVFGVENKPFHGKTYLGLVTRANNTYESVTQILTRPLPPKECYSFSIYLSQSPTYESDVSWEPSEVKNFNAPTILKIWGGNMKDDEIELLVETPVINHSDWKKYTLNFSPSKKIDHIILEASFLNPKEPANGHLLLDYLSPIQKITCEIENGEIRPSAKLGLNTIKQLELMTIVQENHDSISLDNNNELTPESKISLKEIGAKLFRNPTSKVIIYYVGDNWKIRQNRKKAIKAAMLKIGYSPDMFEILFYKNPSSAIGRRPWKLKDNELLLDLGKR